MIFAKAIKKRNSKGFTLIEIAIGLIILGILIALGVALMGPLTKQAKVIDTREAVKAAKEALTGYAVKNGFLPTTIGPSGGRELDAWGKSLVYAVATSLNGSGNACNLTSTDRTVFECTNTACTTANQKDNVAFIVYSTGQDAEGTGTTTQPTGGPACPGSKTCYWIREQASSYTVGAITYEYDDIVQYVTLDEIRSARACSFTITNQSLPDAKTGVAYSVQLQASGGQTPYTSWATGQAQGSCAAGSVRLTASDIGICLNTTSGLISGTPTIAGVYNFTVTLTDANGVQTLKTFTLNVIDSCLAGGMYIRNSTGANRGYRINWGACTALNANLSVNVLPANTIQLYNNTGCGVQQCTGQTINYTFSQGYDANNNCLISWTAIGATCTFTDL
jgi:prepilin-type N-terminal cleavage/methylation domain-containing protein